MNSPERVLDKPTMRNIEWLFKLVNGLMNQVQELEHRLARFTIINNDSTGVNSLEALTDVAISSKKNFDVLTYVSGWWQNITRKHDMLDSDYHSDVYAEPIEVGDMLAVRSVGGGTKWRKLGIGQSSKYLRSDGSGPLWKDFPTFPLIIDRAMTIPAGEGCVMTEIEIAVGVDLTVNGELVIV